MTFNLDSYRPMPVSYELRYMMLKKIKAGEDPLPGIEGREETKTMSSGLSLAEATQIWSAGREQARQGSQRA